MKMKNKVLVKIIVPEVDDELVWKIKKLVSEGISDLTSSNFDFSREYVFINPKTNMIYKENDTILQTDIRNSTELILISVNNQNVK